MREVRNSGDMLAVHLVGHLAGLVDLDAGEADPVVEAESPGVLADYADVHPNVAGVRHGSAEGVDEPATVRLVGGAAVHPRPAIKFPPFGPEHLTNSLNHLAELAAPT